MDVISLVAATASILSVVMTLSLGVDVYEILTCKLVVFVVWLFLYSVADEKTKGTGSKQVERAFADVCVLCFDLLLKITVCSIFIDDDELDFIRILWLSYRKAPHFNRQYRQLCNIVLF